MQTVIIPTTVQKYDEGIRGQLTSTKIVGSSYNWRTFIPQARPYWWQSYSPQGRHMKRQPYGINDATINYFVTDELQRSKRPIISYLNLHLIIEKPLANATPVSFSPIITRNFYLVISFDEVNDWRPFLSSSNNVTEFWGQLYLTRAFKLVLIKCLVVMKHF